VSGLERRWSSGAGDLGHGQLIVNRFNILSKVFFHHQYLRKTMKLLLQGNPV